MMKLRLKRNETRETLEFEMADTSNLHDLCLRISSSTHSSVHFSVKLKRNDKPSPQNTLRSLPYSLHPSVFAASSSQMDVEIVAYAGSKRLSELFLLQKVLLEKSDDDANAFTTLAASVHAVMLESGFVLLNNHGRFDNKFTFSKELLTVSLRYTLPELITKTTIEYVTVRFQSLGNTVVVYGSLGGCMVQRVHLNKNRFVRVIDLVVDTLKFEKQASCISYREAFTFWKMVKDGLSIPLLTDLCEKYGLEPPASLMRLPTELKMKILELVPGDSVAKTACVCREMRCLASDNDLWKQKFLEEAMYVVVNRPSISWKAEFAACWKQRQNVINRRGTSPAITPQSRFDRMSRLREMRRLRRQR